MLEESGLGTLGITNSVVFNAALTDLISELQLASICDFSDPESCFIDSEFRANFYNWESLRIGLGVAARYDSSRGKLLFAGPDPDKVSQAACRTYANLEWTASEKMTLNSGLITEKVEQGNSNTSYRVAANYQLAERQAIRLAANHAYRAPTILERFYRTDYVYNEDIMLDAGVRPDLNIVAEQLPSYEIGYGGSFLDKNLLLDVRIFKEDLSGACRLIVSVARQVAIRDHFCAHLRRIYIVVLFNENERKNGQEWCRRSSLIY